MKMATTVLWILLAVSLLTTADCAGYGVYAKLLRDIFHGYNSEIRHVQNLTSPTLIKIRMTMYQIRELNVRFQYLQTNVWLGFTWKDEYLHWNPDKYGGLHHVNVPSEKVWRPDIVLYNSVDDERLVNEILANTEVKLFQDGTVVWNMPAILKTSCKIDMTDYPFDIQKCKFKFGSWTYHGFEINVTNDLDAAIMKNFITNGEFEVLGVPSVRNDHMYACCPEPYPDVTFTVILKRRPLFVIMNLILPCLFLIAIGVLVFYLPPESGEKVGLAVTVLLAMMVFLLLIMESTPPTSEVVPLIQQFFMASIALLSVATIMSVIIMNFHFKGEHSTSPPEWVRVITYDVLARITCMRPIIKLHLEAFKDCRLSKRLKEIKSSMSKANGNSVVLLNYSPMKTENGAVVCNSSAPLPPIRNLETSIPDDNNISTKLLTAILEELKEQRISKKEVSKRKEAFREIECEWKVIAMIIDRFFLFCFALLCFTAIVGVFSRIPSGYHNSQGM